MLSQREAEALGWVFVHERPEEVVITSETQGEQRTLPPVWRAERYFSLPGQGQSLINYADESLEQVLEQITAFEAQLPDLPEPVASEESDEDARTGFEPVESEQVVVNASQDAIDGASPDSVLVVRAGESPDEVVSRKNDIPSQEPGPQVYASELPVPLSGEQVAQALEPALLPGGEERPEDDPELVAYREMFPPEEDEAPDATEAAIELAEENGVDLSEVDGSGEDGRITKPDVEQYLEEQDSSDESDADPPEGE